MLEDSNMQAISECYIYDCYNVNILNANDFIIFFCLIYKTVYQLLLIYKYYRVSTKQIQIYQANLQMSRNIDRHIK